MHSLDNEGVYEKLEPVLIQRRRLPPKSTLRDLRDESRKLLPTAPNSAPGDVLEAVANRRDLPALVEHLNAVGANIVHVGGVLSSMADMCDLPM